ncbi:DotU family type IV/VI secretion system protein [Celerinatantimonas sp. MCCC 1A17872]|uniref:DotU family type IV/VI secretion system protein n=1 Tax=Celerinatantimonas sp. MCCC 1A17872 TaxID=3177514 RepID=UPI0038BE44B9
MHLCEIFLEFFSFIQYLVSSAKDDLPDYETVRDDIELLIKQMDSKSTQLELLPEQYDQARFAVFAWADETILCSSWIGAKQWIKNTLQRQYYGTVNAGEEFFVRMDKLKAQCLSLSSENSNELLEDSLEQSFSSIQDVLEVYTLSIAMGFSGKYFNEDGSFLNKLKKESVEQILPQEENKIYFFNYDEKVKSNKNIKNSQMGKIFNFSSIVIASVSVLTVIAIFFIYQGLLQQSLELWFG